MVRFVDFSVQPGHKYRYRIQLWLEDPNRPTDLQMEPRETELSDAVKVRLKEVTCAEGEEGVGSSTANRRGVR